MLQLIQVKSVLLLCSGNYFEKPVQGPQIETNSYAELRAQLLCNKTKEPSALCTIR